MGTAFKICGKDTKKNFITEENLVSRNWTKNSKIISYKKPLVIAVLVILTGLFLCLSPQKATLNLFAKVWCIFQSFAVLLNAKEQIKFYQWWKTSNLSDAHLRGLGTNGYPLFGFIKLPPLSLKSTKFVTNCYAGLLLLCALFADCSYVGFLFILTFIFSVFYFSSLWAERTASYHREYLTLSILLYFCFTPGFFGKTGMDMMIVDLIKLHITSIYVAGALQKIACSIIGKRPWFLFSPHALLWRAMWSKPYFSSIQKFFFQHPKLMAFGGLYVLSLELLFFMNFFMSKEFVIILIVGIILFHILVFLLQGIDYITFWNPAFLLWFIFPTSSLALSVQEFSLYLALALIFCAAQLVYAFCFIENLNINVPPLTCCPMFVNLFRFNDKFAQYYCLWDLRSEIRFERLEWIYPFAKVESGLGLVESDVAKLPFPFVGFGYYKKPQNCPTLLAKWFRDDLIKQDFFLYANYEVSKKLIDHLAKLMIWLHEENYSRSPFDEKFLYEVMEKYEKCQELFRIDLLNFQTQTQTSKTSVIYNVNEKTIFGLS